jgi:hypothetical protein
VTVLATWRRVREGRMVAVAVERVFVLPGPAIEILEL